MTHNINKAIGIFDSGIGGLTVLKEIIQRLPKEDTVYLGDTARVPYGTKSPETVTRYSFENTSFLLKHDIKLLVVACNTSSAISLKQIEKTLSIPVIGVLEPGAKAALKATKSKRVGVIGTEATIGSGAYPDAIKRLDSGVVVIGSTCPLFVPLVEEGWIDNEITLMIAERYLDPLKREEIDTLLLGCTHYPLLKDIIKKIMGDGVSLIDSAQETAIEVERILSEKRILRESSHKGSREYFVTDAPGRFINLGERLLGIHIDNVKQINT